MDRQTADLIVKTHNMEKVQLRMHIEALEDIVRDALREFRRTQKLGHYPDDHWSHRAMLIVRRVRKSKR